MKFPDKKLAKRALSHLNRLKREGDALLLQNTIDPIAHGRWASRVHDYLERTFGPSNGLNRALRDIAEVKLEDVLNNKRPNYSLWRRGIHTHMITLASFIEKLEAQLEHEE